MQRTYLGEFEELVLLIVGILHDEAYGVAVLEEIEKQTGRKNNISAVHSALRRLEEKGFTRSRMGGATAMRGGRRKRFFSLTVAGKGALDRVHSIRDRLWHQIPKISFS